MQKVDASRTYVKCAFVFFTIRGRQGELQREAIEMYENIRMC
jgi:hypothetical protein